MATLESILKLKDSFTNTINKISNSINNVAQSGGKMSSSLNSGLDSTDSSINKTGNSISRLSAMYDNFKNKLSGSGNSLPPPTPPEPSFEMGNLTEIEKANEAYGNITEKLEYMKTKLSSQTQQHNMWIAKVRELQNEYNKLQQSGKATNTSKQFFALQQAKNQMANLGLATHSTQEKIKKLSVEESRVAETIKRCEREQSKFNLAVQKVQSVADTVKTKFSSIGSTIGTLKSKIHNMIDSSKSKMSTMGAGLGGYLKAFLGIAALRKLIDGTIGAGARLSQQMNSMIGMFGNADVGRSYFEKLKNYASQSGQKIEDLTRITQQFLSTTKNTDHLMGLNEIAEKLAFKNQSQGLEGAGYAINEALSGQYTSLKNRFNLSSAQLEPIKKAIAKGNMEGVISAFNGALDSAGITDAVIEGFRNSVPSQMARIANEVKTKFAEAGMGALEHLQPILESINNWLNSSGATEFFSVISNGLGIILDGVNWLGQTISANWDVIQPILLALGIMAAVVGAVMFVSWILSALPLFAIAAIIGVVIAKVQEMGVTTDEIIQFICGIFGVLFSTVANVFIGIWNLAVSVAEFLRNVFIDPVYAIKKLFYDMAIEVLKFFDSMVQGIVSGINWVINKINEISGSTLKQVEVNFVSGWIDSLSAKRDGLTSDKNVVDYGHLKKEYIDGAEAFNKGTEVGTKIFNTVSDGFSSAGAMGGGWNDDQLGALDGIKGDTGNISKSVDIANEDLKYLRDIAEQEAINKFTNNTIVPQLQVTFGDVHKDADVDVIIEKITKVMEEAYSVGEEGVHA